MSSSSFAQMPNLKNNSTNAPSDPEQALKRSITNTSRAALEKDKEGDILLSYGDVSFSKTAGGQDMCFIRIKLKNATIYPLSLLKAQFVWRSWQTPLTFSDFEVGQENYIKYKLKGSSCKNLSDKPQIKVSKCVMRNKSLSECGKKIKVIPLE